MLLGQKVDYPKHYHPKILQVISRQEGRKNLPAVFLGVDVWHAYEFSWLDATGIPKVMLLRVSMPATSPYLIESKSFKLYLHSFNFTRFVDENTVAMALKYDLSGAVGADVEVALFSLDDVSAFNIKKPAGLCIDGVLDGQERNEVSDVDSRLLKFADSADGVLLQQYHSHLLRSNCPVTGQPDWATIGMVITAPMIDTRALLAYLLSYRNHNGFHESCVEQIFFDLTQAFSPQSLWVQAWFTRRGGVDINPCRVSDVNMIGAPSRLKRQ